MYPTKKHSFMATRWPLDKTLKTQQTTIQHTGVMMPGRSSCGPCRHTSNHRGRNLTHMHLICSPMAAAALLASLLGPSPAAGTLRRSRGSSRGSWPSPVPPRSSGRVCQGHCHHACAGGLGDRVVVLHERHNAAEVQRRAGGHPAAHPSPPVLAEALSLLCLLDTRIRRARSVDESSPCWADAW